MMSENKITMADLFRESVIFQGVLAVICITGTFLLLVMGRTVPEYVWLIDASVLGFFFGAKNLLTARNSAQDANRVTEMVVAQNAEIISTLAKLGIGGAMGEVLRK